MTTYKTPGVYVEEISTLPPSVAEVSTAIPAFIGHTEKGPALKRISTLLQRDFRVNAEKTRKELQQERTKMGLIITHTGFILDYVTADRGQVLYDGVLTCSSNPREIFKCISQVGYEECVRCAI